MSSCYQTEERSYHSWEFLRCVNWVISRIFQNRVNTSLSFEKEEAERGESNPHEKLRSRYSKRQKGRKYDFGKSKMQPQRYDSWRLQNSFPRSHPIICYFYFPHQFAFV
ncbi:hypothetical protein OIU77_026120 [Salix suchowensis]|uniref:Uncharacterized protein n=1 Tax=Salix suchowensis TaxID=1278906 RepID=A0ABQ9BYL5_9ROSI|nr:hypothetical protein OIU77_026120 [Salix suchowensis]